METTFKRLKEVLGEDKFYTFPESFVNKVCLSNYSKNFLQSIGLPPIQDDLITFYNDPRKMKEIKFEGKDYLVIGDDFGTSICVSCKTDQVLSIDELEELPERFLNSNLEKMVACFQIYYSYKEALQDVADDEASELVDKIRDEFNEVDPQCLEDEESWWSVILEQTEDGLM